MISIEEMRTNAEELIKLAAEDRQKNDQIKWLHHMNHALFWGLCSEICERLERIERIEVDDA